MKKVILTYGTFDLFHIGHLKILNRLKALGDYLIVGVSTDQFNAEKGKKTIIGFEDRIEIVRSVRCVDLAIPESCWEQKAIDIAKYNVNVLGMGDDWSGKFDELKSCCDVVYLKRTDGVSSTKIKRSLACLDQEHIVQLKSSLDLMSSIVRNLS